MSVLALVWGILAFVGFCVGLLPCVGALNWINIPFAVIGVVISIVGMSKASQSGEPKGQAIAGLILSLIAVVVGLGRLIMGGGVL